jgi:hypothetical protein
MALIQPTNDRWSPRLQGESGIGRSAPYVCQTRQGLMWLAAVTREKGGLS